jgi:hypothetical protein
MEGCIIGSLFFPEDTGPGHPGFSIRYHNGYQAYVNGYWKKINHITLFWDWNLYPRPEVVYGHFWGTL